MKNKIVYFLCTLLLPVKIFAVNIDSLIDAKIHIDKPYLIINLTSTDCITCRAGGVNLIKKLSDKVDKNKIILLSDDKNMSLYYQQYSNIFNGYKRVYDKVLSKALALGPFSSACLVLNNCAHNYSFKNMDIDTFNYVNESLLNSLVFDNKEYKVKDSVFDNVPNLFFCDSYAMLFNVQFQIGLYYSMSTNIKKYTQPEYSDTTINILYNKEK